MKTKLFILVLLCIKFASGQDFITGEIIHKVVCIKYNDKIATSFLINYDSLTYLITAKHVVDSSSKTATIHGQKITINIFQNSIWKPVSGKVLFHENKNIDIAVIKLNGKLESD